MDTNIVMKYRRPADCWVCTECEMENGIEFGTCSFCGAPRSYGAQILRRWTPADDAPPVTPPVYPTAPTYGGPGYAPPTAPTPPPYGGYPTPPRTPMPGESTSDSGIIALVVVLGIVFLLVIFAILLAVRG